MAPTSSSLAQICGSPPWRGRSLIDTAMHRLFASGRAVDIVLVVIAIELGWLITAGGWRTVDALLRLAPGALMLVALRAALSGSDWYWIALPLLMSFPIHLADLARHRR